MSVQELKLYDPLETLYITLLCYIYIYFLIVCFGFFFGFFVMAQPSCQAATHFLNTSEYKDSEKLFLSWPDSKEYCVCVYIYTNIYLLK